MGVRRGIDRKKVECRSLIDAYLEGQVGVNKFKLYPTEKTFIRGKTLWLTEAYSHFLLFSKIHSLEKNG